MANAATTRFGCSFSICNEFSSPFVSFVCQYGKPYVSVDVPIYKEGPPCNDCNDSCVFGSLCNNDDVLIYTNNHLTCGHLLLGVDFFLEEYNRRESAESRDGATGESRRRTQHLAGLRSSDLRGLSHFRAPKDHGVTLRSSAHAQIRPPMDDYCAAKGEYVAGVRTTSEDVPSKYPTKAEFKRNHQGSAIYDNYKKRRSIIFFQIGRCQKSGKRTEQ
ncbi:hypothetical protein KIN20_016875 [Parelaphostrongylus tenuis]|uniref:Uncharacterized protein n=1 Tax=Parelaphostrongylus tenuis TaxID=148309 RepID=A0AAD5MKP3_PARTN|nr:hypothetical protein KIN20_016875 [Parelaphostrongylus tenuis]